MKKIILLLTLVAASLIAVPSTAQAKPAPSGWTPKICYEDTGWHARVCTSVYVTASSHVEVIDVCVTRTQKGGYFAGTKSSKITVKGKNNSGTARLYNVETSGTSEVCELTELWNGSLTVTKKGYYVASGTLNMKKLFGAPDQPWSICGKYVAPYTC